MNSCLYNCTVMHHRTKPKENKFSYRIFMFLIDLDELKKLHQKNKLISYNRFNLFSFSDKDHANFPSQNSDRYALTKDKIMEYLSRNGINPDEIKRIALLTNLTTLGYIFNPISVYYCYNPLGEIICAVAEVCNTFGEMKLYLLGKETRRGDTLRLYTPKNFYVSPFSELDIYFSFIIKKPETTLKLYVNDFKNGDCFLSSSLTGERKEISDLRLFLYFLRFPMITVKIIALIYWQALILYLKRIPFIRKKQNISLQQNLVKLS